MTPEDKKEIQEIICQVETDLKSHEDERERRLLIIEFCLLPIAATLLILYPIPAASAVFLPNLVLRAYQIVRYQ